MSLVEYCAYLKREIFMLKSQIKKLKRLAEALSQQNLMSHSYKNQNLS